MYVRQDACICVTWLKHRADADLKQLTVIAFAISAVIGVGGSIVGGETGGTVYWITYLGAGIPLALIAVGSSAPGLIGAAVAGIKWKVDPTNNKACRHCDVSLYV